MKKAIACDYHGRSVTTAKIANKFEIRRGLSAALVRKRPDAVRAVGKWNKPISEVLPVSAAVPAFTTKRLLYRVSQSQS